jgi:N-acetylneuraminic acid mutarotase
MRDFIDSIHFRKQTAIRHQGISGWLGFIPLALTLAINLPVIQQAQSASFITTGSMNIGRDYYTATLLASGKVLVTGGWNGSAPTNTVELYDPVAGIWTNTGPMTTNRDHHTATLLTNGKVLVVGGLFSSGNPLSSSELYDPASGVWTQTTNSLTNPRWDHTTTLLQGGKVLVAGGNINISPYFLSSAELYDPVTGAWTTTGSMAIGRDLHTATLLPNGQVLVTGGMGATNKAELYDPATEKWKMTGIMPNVRWSHTATLLPNGKILVVGGVTNLNSFGSHSLSSVDLYDPSIGTWRQCSPMTMARVFHTATVLSNGKLLITGGSSNYPVALSSSEIYEPSTGIWMTNGLLNTAHMIHTATLLTNGQVLIAGGYSSNSGIISSAEVYTSANLTVMPFRLDDPEKLPGGMLQFAFTNTPDVSFIAYGTTNLSVPFDNWTVLDGPSEVSSGRYQLIDFQATNSPQRFYRVRAP